MRPWIGPRLQTALAKACMASCTSRTPALDRVSSVLGGGGSEVGVCLARFGLARGRGGGAAMKPSKPSSPAQIFVRLKGRVDPGLGSIPVRP